MDLELPGDRALLRREGDRLILEPIRPAGLAGLLSQWSPIEDDLLNIADPPSPREDLLG